MLMYSAHVLIVFGSCEVLENKKSSTNNKIRGQNYILVFDIHICNNIPLSCSTARPRVCNSLGIQDFCLEHSKELAK